MTCFFIEQALADLRPVTGAESLEYAMELCAVLLFGCAVVGWAAGMGG